MICCISKSTVQKLRLVVRSSRKITSLHVVVCILRLSTAPPTMGEFDWTESGRAALVCRGWKRGVLFQRAVESVELTLSTTAAEL